MGLGLCEQESQGESGSGSGKRSQGAVMVSLCRAK